MKQILLAGLLALLPTLNSAAQPATPFTLQAAPPLQLQPGAVANDVAVINATGAMLPALLVPTQGLNTLFIYPQPRPYGTP